MTLRAAEAHEGTVGEAPATSNVSVSSDSALPSLPVDYFRLNPFPSSSWFPQPEQEVKTTRPLPRHRRHRFSPSETAGKRPHFYWPQQPAYSPAGPAEQNQITSKYPRRMILKSMERGEFPFFTWFKGGGSEVWFQSWADLSQSDGAKFKLFKSESSFLLIFSVFSKSETPFLLMGINSSRTGPISLEVCSEHSDWRFSVVVPDNCCLQQSMATKKSKIRKEKQSAIGRGQIGWDFHHGKQAANREGARAETWGLCGVLVPKCRRNQRVWNPFWLQFLAFCRSKPWFSKTMFLERELGIGNWGLEMRENKGSRRESLEGINLVSNFFHHHH